MNPECQNRDRCNLGLWKWDLGTQWVRGSDSAGVCWPRAPHRKTCILTCILVNIDTNKDIGQGLNLNSVEIFSWEQAVLWIAEWLAPFLVVTTRMVSWWARSQRASNHWWMWREETEVPFFFIFMGHQRRCCAKAACTSCETRSEMCLSSFVFGDITCIAQNLQWRQHWRHQNQTPAQIRM